MRRRVKRRPPSLEPSFSAPGCSGGTGGWGGVGVGVGLAERLVLSPPQASESETALSQPPGDARPHGSLRIQADSLTTRHQLTRSHRLAARPPESEPRQQGRVCVLEFEMCRARRPHHEVRTLTLKCFQGC